LSREARQAPRGEGHGGRCSSSFGFEGARAAQLSLALFGAAP